MISSCSEVAVQVGLWNRQRNETKIKCLMQFKQHIPKSLIISALCGTFALGFLSQTKAEDKKADPSGTWTWTMPGRNGGPDRKMTLKLKSEGDKVTGKL